MKSDLPETSNNRDSFTVMAVAYLILPALVFLLTWVRPVIGIPVAVIVVAAYILFWFQKGPSEPRLKLSKGTWAYVLILAFLWTLVGGIGGFVWQAGDYEKHNLAFHDLLTQSWPVMYANGTNTTYLCYGLGYYLAPAFIARAAGAGWLPAATFLWGFIGLVLFFYWVATFSRFPKRTLGIVLLFAATETLWHMYLHILHTPPFDDAGKIINASLDHLGVRSDYSDSFSALQFRPQHVIPAWLGSALFYDMFWVRRNPRGAGLAWAACWLWSPLMSLGLLIVPLTAWKRWRWQDAVEPVNFGAGILLLVLAVYFQGHVPLTEQGPIWKFSAGGNWLVLYPWFLLLELSPMAILFWADLKYNLMGGLRPLFLTSVIVLVLLPLYKIGYYGDQRLQGQTPALLFIGLAASRCFLSASFSLKRPVFALLVASQLLGAVYPFARWWQEAFGLHIDYSYAGTRQAWGYQNLSDFKRFGYDYAAQYLGRTNSLAAHWLLRSQAGPGGGAPAINRVMSPRDTSSSP